MTDSPGTIKCVVWDLDYTLWDGILLEDPRVTLKPDAADVIRTLDERGILHSVASRSDFAAAMQQLTDFGLDEYFLDPQINWSSKAESIRAIAESIGIGLEAIAFVDDEPFERDEVAFSLPEVTCIDARELSRVPAMAIMQPRFITLDSRRRRRMMRDHLIRREAERRYTGPREAFLASLGMKLTVFPAAEQDLQRAEELTVRTHQLNATGVTYSYEQLDAFRRSAWHELLMAHLEDRYGSYGHVGLALIECSAELWTIKLLLMSCRVISRGVGSALLAHLMNHAARQGVRLRAEFVPNPRNRMMAITYRFAGFRPVEQRGELTILEADLTNVPQLPDYMTLTVRPGPLCRAPQEGSQ